MDMLAVFIAVAFSALRLATPLIFASMGGMLSERSGVVNIALEGFILVGAFSGSVAAHYGASAWMGWFAALFCGLIAGAVFAFFVIELKADQIVTGTAINLLAMGLIPFVSKIMFDSTGSTPAILVEDRFTFEPLVMAFLVAGFLYYMMNYMRAGLWVTFAGEHPEALLASGIAPRKVRWASVIASGGLAALGGASLSLYLASAYSPLMSGGRGFMALAALIFGKWKPLPALCACLFFGLADAMQIRLQGTEIGGFEIPVQFIQILPYIVTIITLAGFIGTSRAPKALGSH